MASSSSLLFTFSIILCLSFISTNHAALNSTEFISQVLAGHNAARAEVGVPPLVWEPILATYAKGYADYRRPDCRLSYSPRWGFGENLFSKKRFSAKDAISAWVAEKQWYTHENNTCAAGKDCSDYRQVVWRNTIRVGCAIIKCDSGNQYMVCEYYPAGNYLGARPY